MTKAACEICGRHIHCIECEGFTCECGNTDPNNFILDFEAAYES